MIENSTRKPVASFRGSSKGLHVYLEALSDIHRYEHALGLPAQLTRRMLALMPYGKVLLKAHTIRRRWADA